MTTVYLDVDGRHRPVATDYVAAFERLADNLRRRAHGRGDKRLASAVEADIERMRAWLGGGLERARTRGVAMFSCSEEDFFEAIQLQRPVRDESALDLMPRVTQLLAFLEEDERFLVALVDRRRLRLLRFELGEVEELPAITDPEPRAIDISIELGSFEHHAEEAARIHFRHSAEHLERALRKWPAAGLIVAGPDEAVAGLQAYLPRSITDKIVGRARLAVTAPPHEIAEVALEIQDTVDRRRQAEAVEQLRQQAASGRGGVVGLEATLAALARQRVATLFVSEGFTATGAGCPSCGHLGVGVRQCPQCGTTNEEIEDVVEVALDEAIAQGATIEFCRDSELDRFGRIGAVERY